MNRNLVVRAIGPGIVAAAVAITPAAHASAAVDDALIAALAHGDGPGAARAIVIGGFQSRPSVLGDAIFHAGIAAVDGGLTDQFAKAVAWGLPHGDVPVLVANEAFGAAAGTAASHGLTAGQIRAGVEAVSLTDEAYLGQGPKTWTGVTSTANSSSGPAAPALSHFRIAPAVLRKGSPNPTVSFTDSQAATTTLGVHSLSGVRKGSRCVPASAKTARGSRSCSRDVVVGRFTHHDTAGSNKVLLPRSIRRTLSPGRYALVAAAAGPGGSSASVSTRFTVA